MTQQIKESIAAHLVVNFGSMPREAEIMADIADNHLPADTTFEAAISYLRNLYNL